MSATSPAVFDPSGHLVDVISKRHANDLVVAHHYLHRRPSNKYSFAMWAPDGRTVGVVIFGTPASRHLQLGAFPPDPSLVIELNRLWVDDSCGRNAESYFVSRALAALPAHMVVSYADTKWDHIGTVYRALNFFYAGWTDMERRLARPDYIPPGEGRHTRDAFRGPGQTAQWTHRVRRQPKAKYWTATGNRRERKAIIRGSGWPRLSWHDHPVPSEHRKLVT